jgi:hypothetical protein
LPPGSLFHESNSFDFGSPKGKFLSVSREISDAIQPCKAKDNTKTHSRSRPFAGLPPGGATSSLLYIPRESGVFRMPAAPAADPRFNEFIILQAQNAGLFLGQIPHPHSGEKQINLRAAKSVIDSLEMLASKTRGNLTDSETKLLATALDNLRPLFEAALASAEG